MWNKAALAAAMLLAAAAPKLVEVVSAAARPAPLPVSARATDENRLAATCRFSDIGDSRPDPAWVSASYGSDGCIAPPLPGRIDGHAATREQIVAGMAAVTRYQTGADAFQKCISDHLAARKAGPDKPSGAFITIESYRIAVSEKNKKKADRQMDAAIEAFNTYGSDCPG